MDFFKEHLQKLPLYSLRQLGRELGVKCPTSLTKARLIEAIVDIESGAVNPCFNSSKLGRPALANQKNSDYLNALPFEKINKIKLLISSFEKELLEIILK